MSQILDPRQRPRSVCNFVGCAEFDVTPEVDVRSLNDSGQEPFKLK